MPSSKPPNSGQRELETQMGLDFAQENQYIIAPFEGEFAVEAELFEKLEEKINGLINSHTALKEENQRLAQENQRLQQEREGLKGRIDTILSKLEGL